MVSRHKLRSECHTNADGCKREGERGGGAGREGAVGFNVEGKIPSSVGILSLDTLTC